MAEGNGSPPNWETRMARMEEIVAGLVEHAAMTNDRIEELRLSQRETNASVQNLVGTIRDLIDRIPPENLR
jgi:uncharacterized coiled-coil DUF342 family protein